MMCEIGYMGYNLEGTIKELWGFEIIFYIKVIFSYSIIL
jgi:hypothetical protein